jgi:hypothetical protein
MSRAVGPVSTTSPCFPERTSCPCGLSSTAFTAVGLYSSAPLGKGRSLSWITTDGPDGVSSLPVWEVGSFAVRRFTIGAEASTSFLAGGCPASALVVGSHSAAEAVSASAARARGESRPAALPCDGARGLRRARCPRETAYGEGDSRSGDSDGCAGEGGATCAGAAAGSSPDTGSASDSQIPFSEYCR